MGSMVGAARREDPVRAAVRVKWRGGGGAGSVDVSAVNLRASRDGRDACDVISALPVPWGALGDPGGPTSEKRTLREGKEMEKGATEERK